MPTAPAAIELAGWPRFKQLERRNLARAFTADAPTIARVPADAIGYPRIRRSARRARTTTSRFPFSQTAEVRMTASVQPEKETTVLATIPPAPISLIARDGQELARAHAKMIEWAVMMGSSLEAERAEQITALDIADSNGWATTTFENRIRVLYGRKLFYAKIETALRAGYVIVPNFAMNTFAIRTKAKNPRGRPVTARYRPRESYAQQPQLLAPGEGEFRSDRPTVATDTEIVKEGDSTVTKYTVYPDELTGIDFPISMAKPEIMSVAAAALAEKLFDEIGVAEDWNSGARGDPILLGRLRNPRRGRPGLTFFLAWHFDPSRL
jgi:hypothetical protein